MKKMRLFSFFLLVNFGALGLGSLLMGSSPIANEWYTQLNKAPWTPPGWVFGVAWTSIMLLFTIYLTLQKIEKINHSTFFVLFGAQFILNVSWNPVFFYFHWTFLGMILIFSLIISLILILKYFKSGIFQSLFLLPYIIWLTIAFSLNSYSWWMN